ncbi:MAG: hypothetical protein JWP35_593 [Caulobacter sp.]|nr:hypothetical protein [Caulobacter sp.]
MGLLSLPPPSAFADTSPARCRFAVEDGKRAAHRCAALSDRSDALKAYAAF